jgi:hypothetical protein
MNIPESAIEPFGYDIPTLVMVRQGNNPALIARIFKAIDATFVDVRRKWAILQHYREHGFSTDGLELDEDTLRLRAVFAGGERVECNITEWDDGLHMSISFNVPGETSRYGSTMEHPDGDTYY